MEQHSETPSVRCDIQLKAQSAILKTLLPALLKTIQEVTEFMIDVEDDEEIHAHIRELATETVIDEVISLLTRDQSRASRSNMVYDVDGIGIDTLIACYSELTPHKAHKWYAERIGADQERYTHLLRCLPEHIKW